MSSILYKYNFKLKDLRILRQFSSPRYNSTGTNTSNKQEIQQAIRSAQAIELFRSSFYKSSKNSINISISDLDQLILSEKVRPSLTIGVVETIGFLAGNLVRIIPANHVTSYTTKIIDEAITEQLNDSIRRLQSSENIDVKETLKFHRDVSTTNSNEFNHMNNDNLNSSKVTSTDIFISSSIRKIFSISECI